MWHLAIFDWTADPHDALNLLPAHLEWIRREQLAGRMLFAGPGDNGEKGIIVFAHMTQEEAEALCRSDPFVTEGHRRYTLIAWDVHQALGVGFQTTPVAPMTHTDSRGTA
ncbi:YciI family protein [Mycolicibacterium sp. CBMA 226]|uniref:YciI family protein n=1 Tax=Mycolicibacterium sp. CBMA 226 TaxID=2606611 RepID=UPI0012DF4C34|nr:YciI family protein [Mycolicibacterium sp. CBMA 226]MUL77129.1 hypothetical protein [Mycolicibacterium sp. CBMA 226]